MAKRIVFGGHVWQVRDYNGGPGPNRFSDKLVSIDSEGQLHLKIAKIGGIYHCSELYLEKPLGYGTYSFSVAKVPILDKNTILGLFTYENDKNEIDIEFGSWGCNLFPNFQYVVQPTKWNSFKKVYGYDYDIASEFTWKKTGVDFKSDLWPFKPEWSFTKWSPQSVGKERVHINLWQLKGKAPATEQEVIIKSFEFKPL